MSSNTHHRTDAKPKRPGKAQRAKAKKVEDPLNAEELADIPAPVDADEPAKARKKKVEPKKTPVLQPYTLSGTDAEFLELRFPGFEFLMPKTDVPENPHPHGVLAVERLMGMRSYVSRQHGRPFIDIGSDLRRWARTDQRPCAVVSPVLCAQDIARKEADEGYAAVENIPRSELTLQELVARPLTPVVDGVPPPNPMPFQDLLVGRDAVCVHVYDIPMADWAQAIHKFAWPKVTFITHKFPGISGTLGGGNAAYTRTPSGDVNMVVGDQRYSHHNNDWLFQPAHYVTFDNQRCVVVCHLVTSIGDTFIVDVSLAPYSDRWRSEVALPLDAYLSNPYDVMGAIDIRCGQRGDEIIATARFREVVAIGQGILSYKVGQSDQAFFASAANISRLAAAFSGRQIDQGLITAMKARARTDGQTKADCCNNEVVLNATVYLAILKMLAADSTLLIQLNELQPVLKVHNTLVHDWQTLRARPIVTANHCLPVSIGLFLMLFLLGLTQVKANPDVPESWDMEVFEVLFYSAVVFAAYVLRCTPGMLLAPPRAGLLAAHHDGRLPLQSMPPLMPSIPPHCLKEPDQHETTILRLKSSSEPEKQDDPWRTGLFGAGFSGYVMGSFERTGIYTEYVALRERTILATPAPIHSRWVQLHDLFCPFERCLQRTQPGCLYPLFPQIHLTDEDLQAMYTTWNNRFPGAVMLRHDAAQEAIALGPTGTDTDTLRGMFQKQEKHFLELPGELRLQIVDHIQHWIWVSACGQKPEIPRAIQSVSDPANVRLGPFTHALQHAFCTGIVDDLGHYLPVVIACGLTGTDVGLWFAAALSVGYVGAICCDFSRFDAHVSTHALKFEEHIYRACGIDAFPEALATFRAQYHTVGYGKHYHFERNGTRKSGDPNTSFGNSLLNAAINVFALYEGARAERPEMTIHDFMLNLRLIVMGDDALAIVNCHIEMETYRRTLTDLGFKSKAFWLEPSELCRAEFCSSVFVPTIHQGQPSYQMVLKPGKLLGTTPWRVGPLPPDMTCLDWFSGVMKGFRGAYDCMPAVAAWIEYWASKTGSPEERPRYYLDKRSDIQADDLSLWFEQRYGVSYSLFESELEQVLELFKDVEVTVPALINSDVITQVIIIDSA